MYADKRKKDGGNVAKNVICSFSDAIFSQSAYMGDLESKEFGLFQRNYFTDDTLGKIAL